MENLGRNLEREWQFTLSNAVQKTAQSVKLGSEEETSKWYSIIDLSLLCHVRILAHQIQNILCVPKNAW